MALLIGIAGGTGSGKTTVARSIGTSLPADKVSTIEYDAYYRDRTDLDDEARSHLNFDHPDSLESELLVTHLRSLKEGHAVDVPIYDFKTHSRRTEVHRVEPTPVIILEGILVFVEPSKRWADLIIPEGGNNRVALDLILAKLRSVTG
jgi:uridine kinase